MILKKRGFILGLIFLISFTFLLSADDYDFRNYLTFNYNFIESRGGLTLKPFVKIEERFRDSGVVLNKFNAGLKIGFFKWLNSDLFYSLKELFYNGSVRKDLLTAGLTFSFHLSRWNFKSRHRNEWHLSNEFVRYRNYSETDFKINRQFGVYASEEFRIDSDEKRINQNDIRTGIDIKIDKKTKFRIFMAMETKRRHSPVWQRTYYLGFSVETSLSGEK